MFVHRHWNIDQVHCLAENLRYGFVSINYTFKIMVSTKHRNNNYGSKEKLDQFFI